VHLHRLPRRWLPVRLQCRGGLVGRAARQPVVCLRHRLRLRRRATGLRLRFAAALKRRDTGE
jgi:hypothetical protein